MTVRKRGEHWYLDISDKSRYRVQLVIKGARTKAQALEADPIDADGKEYILRLRKRFSMPIEYQTWQAIVAEAKTVPRS